MKHDYKREINGEHYVPANNEEGDEEASKDTLYAEKILQ